MELYADHYPIFQANQVLTNDHLNEVFTYLDQQSRHTRSHLVGIGIICGLDINLQANGILLGKGCAVTSEGYLIEQPSVLSLVSYRDYNLPDNPEYGVFKRLAAPQARPVIWELMLAGEPNTTPITPAFLTGKVVLLFLELKQQGLRNCSPNNCDDKGSEVTATIKPLLVTKIDADKLLTAAQTLGTGLATADIAATLSARLDLPDLALGRFDVPNSQPRMTEDIYTRFLSVFRTLRLVRSTAQALSAAYTAFKPLLQSAYATDPFVNFTNTYGFLETGPNTRDQVLHLQHYYGFFADIISAYDEFRWKGLDVICACSPSMELFPRHVMLGLVNPAESPTPRIYRNTFLPSPALHDREIETAEVLQLFTRLVEMTLRFAVPPALSVPANLIREKSGSNIDPQIRITPSRKSGLLATKAIPYYYDLKAPRPLYTLWDSKKSKRNRDNQNLGYRSDEFQPAAPEWIKNSLRFDLEPFNFFRIEGHIRKDYRVATRTLINLRKQHRLPFDIVALRTGSYDNSQEVQFDSQSAHFQDLSALYKTLQENLNSSLAETTREIYDLGGPEDELSTVKPLHPLLKKYAANYQYMSQTMGAWFERSLVQFLVLPYIEIDQDSFDQQAFAALKTQITGNFSNLSHQHRALAVVLWYILKLAELSSESLDRLAIFDFQNRYKDLLSVLRVAKSAMDGNNTSQTQILLYELCETALLNSRLESIQAVKEEYNIRSAKIAKQQYLDHFLDAHPGIEHRGGVPFGGTFILVYHDISVPEQVVSTNLLDKGFGVEALLERDILSRPKRENIEIGHAIVERPQAMKFERAVATTKFQNIMQVENFESPRSKNSAFEIRTKRLTDAFERVRNDSAASNNENVKSMMAEVRKAMVEAEAAPAVDMHPTGGIILSTMDDLPNGTIIADFFLPYRIAGDAPSIQFVLPTLLPSFSLKLGCPNQGGSTPVSVKAKGGLPPYEIAIDEGGFEPLVDNLSFQAGSHTFKLRDADGAEAPQQTIDVPQRMSLNAEWGMEDNGKFVARITISGGSRPYTANGTTLEGNLFVSNSVDSGGTVEVQIIDSNVCSIKQSFTQVSTAECTLPCAGIAVRRGFPFWLPEPDKDNPYDSIEVDQVTFTVDADKNVTSKIDLSDKIKFITRAVVGELSPNSIGKLGENWTNEVNKFLSEQPKLNSPDAKWLQLSYAPPKSGLTGDLTVEYFGCLSFKIVITVNVSRKLDKQALLFDYSPGGCSIGLKNTRAPNTFIPPFEGVTLNKCKADSGEEPFCVIVPELNLETIRSAGPGLSFSAKLSSPSDTLNYIWEAPAGTPPMGSGMSFTCSYAKPGEKTFFVTAIDKDGCRVTSTQTIGVG
jgi:hypothetical protein